MGALIRLWPRAHAYPVSHGQCKAPIETIATSWFRTWALLRWILPANDSRPEPLHHLSYLCGERPERARNTTLSWKSLSSAMSSSSPGVDVFLQASSRAFCTE
jgi:hypothetical protein